MDVNTRVLKAYVNHFLPRDVVGPVIIVFSLEGVIDGIFNLYVPGIEVYAASALPIFHPLCGTLMRADISIDLIGS